MVLIFFKKPIWTKFWIQKLTQTTRYVSFDENPVTAFDMQKSCIILGRLGTV